MIGVAIFIVAILIVAIYLIIELKRFKHRLFAIFLIVLILFIYFSSKIAFKNYTIDYKSISGLISASKIYWGWLVSAFGNLKGITANAIHMDWGANSTIR